MIINICFIVLCVVVIFGIALCASIVLGMMFLIISDFTGWLITKIFRIKK